MNPLQRMTLGALHLLMSLTACTSNASEQSLTVLNFTDQPSVTGPCKASSNPTLVLRRDLVPTPGLPEGLIECSTDAAAPLRTEGLAGTYHSIGKRLLAKDVPGAQAVTAQGAIDYELIVLSNAVAGRDAEYNEWYEHTHLPDVLRNPGFVSAERFKLQTTFSASGYVLPTYAVRYTLRSVDIDATITEINRRLSTGITRWNDAFDSKSLVGRYYEVRQ